MTTTEIKTLVLEIFQQKLQSPNSYFEEAHFLDYLLDPPAAKNTIKNSFRGIRRHSRFFDEVELTFGICFSEADLDRSYSVDQLGEKVKERLDKGKGNRMILQRRLEEKDWYAIELLLTLMLILVWVRWSKKMGQLTCLT
jgi:hypothetical protein